MPQQSANRPLWWLFFCCISLGIGLVGRWLYSDETKIQWSDQRTISHAPTVTGSLLISPYGVWEELLDQLATTKRQLLGRHYAISYDKSLQLLKTLADLWVDISIIHEKAPYGQDEKAFTKLSKQLAHPWILLTGDEALGIVFQHAKVRVGDDDFYVISSANMTYPSFYANREYRFIGHSLEIIKSLQHLFALDIAWSRVTPSDIHPQLLVCPIDCRKKISDALATTTNSVRIAAQYLEDPMLIEQLASLVASGIDVRILVSDNQKREGVEQVEPRMKVLPEPYLHAKELLIDGRLLIHGSMNLSTNALDNNREIGILIDDPEVIKTFARQFERDWEKGEMSE